MSFKGSNRRDEWFRNKTWTTTVEAEFRARLKRSRTAFHKAQYMRIQADSLASAGNARVALNLLDEMLREWPERSEIASARLLRAECLVKLQDIANAVVEYRLALQAQREYPNAKTRAWLEFAWLVTTRGLEEYYDEIRNVISEFESPTELLFPVDRFQYNVAKAILAEASRDAKSAGSFAFAALQNMLAKRSGFRYHATLGLVGQIGPQLSRRLEDLAKSNT